MTPTSELVVDDDLVLTYDGRVFECFRRGVTPGTRKWRIHALHLGIEVKERRDGALAVKIGERRDNRIDGDLRFTIEAARSEQLLEFLGQMH